MWVNDPQAKDKSDFWTKPRPWAFALLAILAAVNFTYGSQFFYDLALKYHQRGWPEMAKMFLYVAEYDNPWDPASKKASVYRRARMPKHNIPHEAESRNIDAYNYDQRDEDFAKASAAFEALIKDYPEFEWPYNNYARMLLEHNQPEKAMKLAEKAVAINPDYVNGRMTLSEAYSQLGKDKEANEQEQYVHTTFPNGVE